MSTDQSTVEYREIKGYPAYRVGDDGSVWSRWAKSKTFPRRGVIGEVWFRMRPGCGSHGYPSVVLHPGRKTFCVHILVLNAFVGPCPKGMEARHFPERDRMNCNRSNLSWSTRSVNQRDRWTQGTDNRGENHYHARLTADIVRDIRRRYAAHECSQVLLAKEFGVHQSVISCIISRKKWAHVA